MAAPRGRAQSAFNKPGRKTRPMSEMASVRIVGSDADEVVRLEAEIVSKRARVARSLGALHEQWQSATSWRRWVVRSSGSAWG